MKRGQLTQVITNMRELTGDLPSMQGDVAASDSRLAKMLYARLWNIRKHVESLSGAKNCPCVSLTTKFNCTSKGMRSIQMPTLYARREPTAEPDGRGTDVQLYRDAACTDKVARFPGHYRSCPDKRYKSVMVNCARFKLRWL
jgi:hypothetical protein